MRVLIAGAGWAGLSCAVELTRAGHNAILIEASRTIGGRSRSQTITRNDKTWQLDNGQHILIGAYSETLRLMQAVGVNVNESFLRMPLTMRFPNGDGLQMPDWANPWVTGWDAAWGICNAQGWTWRDKTSFLMTAARWRLNDFQCEPYASVRDVCTGLTAFVMETFIEPLCVSALNTSCERASGRVFLRVLNDSLFASSIQVEKQKIGSSNLLLPRKNLGDIFPNAAAAWLQKNGVPIHSGVRLQSIHSLQKEERLAQYLCVINGDMSLESKAIFDASFDAVVIAAHSAEAARIARGSGFENWGQQTEQLPQEAIATVYAYAENCQLSAPMLALKSSENQPAQFVFDRGQLTGELGVLAFVISASHGDAKTLEMKTIEQGREQLRIPQLSPIKTIIEKRATFACTPQLERPPQKIANAVFACGDYVQGVYPSTLEGAVRSAVAVTKALSH